MPNLSSTIKAIQNIMRKDAGVDGDAQRISQLVWLLFLKIYDAKEDDYDLTEDNYVSPIPEPLRWRNWAANDEGITGDALLDFVNNDLFPALKELPLRDEASKAAIVRAVFEDSYNYMKSGVLLRQVINEIENSIRFDTNEERHLFNDIYEQILRDLQSAGNAGEYYTPRAATRFVVEMVNPRLGERILDPACGTGGFLINAIEHIQARQGVSNSDERDQLQRSIHGVEKKPLPHLLATTNLILHNIERPGIRRDNLLSVPYQSWTAKDRYDVILSNPPFGGMEEDGIEKNFPNSIRTRETANLFMYLIVHLLKPGGRAGVVLPDGFLFGEGVASRVKEYLLETCNLHTVVRLPNGVFAPYTGIKTNLLFFEKGKPTEHIWFFEHPYPDGTKSYSKSRPLQFSEFDREQTWWNNRTENDHAWRVGIDEIKTRGYNLDFKNPRVLAGETEHSSHELVADLRQSLTDTQTLLDELLAELES
jgi:type I restriction enzyme M protein